MEKEIQELKEMIDNDIECAGGVEGFNDYCAAHEVITSWIERILNIIEKMEENKK